MNVLFHLTTAIAVAAVVTDVNKMEKSAKHRTSITTGAFAFSLSLIAHGALDYIPHCYPINSKFDAIGGLLIIITFILLIDKKYRLILALSFLGSIFPDLIDLAPAIANKLFHLSLPTHQNVFPWHWKQYSGSIYVNNCDVSTLNHLLLVLFCGVICWCRRSSIYGMLKKV